ncbi:photosynthetic complex assembly protein PuhC [Sulfitobacter guttiformis]|uniref:Photosynthetic complex assembly protein PuhC n=1 Tax=Sulfitobacter guttiformis TaxID=74349 RepID=J7G081_9RHOB|nr:photosynthetic complex assembly protein PuhC [Sulfitobacter guttiformis]AFP55412.1 photosynthetic complex assembly protein PuhC [Sulfitobacter guttiformis]KIN75461.1 putative photosynthetic complex assembly protein [Sulfitobacter guttiformis KCTC 32187]RKE92034.1 putative photosynthetic complex assembly protein [Sulfitobacter guttiformis]
MNLSRTASLANQMKERDRDMVPRFLVIAMFSLMAASLALVAFAKLTGMPPTAIASLPEIVAERTVTFAGDRSSGIVLLDEAGTEIATSTEDKAGFIDVVWVAVMRERKVQQTDPNAPIRIVRRDGGRVDVIDDSTGWQLELIGYGKDNVAAFARLIG